MPNHRLRYWPRRVVGEAALSVVCALLALLTAVVPDWFERLAGFSPDEGGGEFEWGLVAVLAAASLASGWWARRDWLRLRPHAAATTGR